MTIMIHIYPYLGSSSWPSWHFHWNLELLHWLHPGGCFPTSCRTLSMALATFSSIFWIASWTLRLARLDRGDGCQGPENCWIVLFFWLRFANKDDKTLGVEDVEDFEHAYITVLRYAQSEADLYLPSAKSHPQLGPELHIQQLQFDTFLAEARDLPLLVSIWKGGPKVLFPEKGSTSSLSTLN